MGDGLIAHDWESTKASILGCGRKASQRLRGKVFVRMSDARGLLADMSEANIEVEQMMIRRGGRSAGREREIFAKMHAA
jgi:hypothetical protein